MDHGAPRLARQRAFCLPPSPPVLTGSRGLSGLPGHLLQGALAENSHQMRPLWTWGLKEYVFVESGVFDLLVFERHPDLAPVAALAFQAGVTEADVHLVKERPVLDQGADLIVPSRKSDPGELNLPVLEGSRARERNTLWLRLQPVDLVQLQRPQMVLAEALDHVGVPHEVL